MSCQALRSDSHEMLLDALGFAPENVLVGFWGFFFPLELCFNKNTNIKRSVQFCYSRVTVVVTDVIIWLHCQDCK